VPPLGIEGIEATDDGTAKDGVRCFGALAIGSLKMKVHKACIARLFERNDLVLDAETIADVARELAAPQT
jgi:methylenetetrahydrofolate/methylenetetrahydromethanopterin dehydrogenase (NADP+)